MEGLNFENMTFESLLNIEDTTYESSEYPELDLLEAVQECADIECEIMRLEKAEIIIEGAELIQKVQYEADETTPVDGEKPAEETEPKSNEKTEEAKKGLGEKIKTFFKNAWDAIVNLWHKLVAAVFNFFKINKNYYDKNKEIIGKNFDKVMNDFKDKPNPALLYMKEQGMNYQTLLQKLSTGLKDWCDKFGNTSFFSIWLVGSKGTETINGINLPIYKFDEIKNEIGKDAEDINIKFAIPNTSVLEYLLGSYKIAQECEKNIKKAYKASMSYTKNDKYTSNSSIEGSIKDNNGNEYTVDQTIKAFRESIKITQKSSKLVTAAIYKVQPLILKIMKACVKGKTDSSEEKKEENK